MGNLTIVIESDILKRARKRALEEGTSVNVIVRDYLADYAGMKAQKMRRSMICCGCPSGRRQDEGTFGGLVKTFISDEGARIS